MILGFVVTAAGSACGIADTERDCTPSLRVLDVSIILQARQFRVGRVWRRGKLPTHSNCCCSQLLEQAGSDAGSAAISTPASGSRSSE